MCSQQEAGILSPVQDGNVKPQIDSNKANNYNIVKDVRVAAMKSIFYLSMNMKCAMNMQVLLILSCWSVDPAASQ